MARVAAPMPQEIKVLEIVAKHEHYFFEHTSISQPLRPKLHHAENQTTNKTSQTHSHKQ